MPVTFQEQAVTPGDGDSKRAKTKLPPIPDLRFEYSYLKNIQPFVKIKRVATRDQKPHTEEGEEEVAEESPREIIEIKWGMVLWVTLRDQVISPLLQGTLWGFASIFLKPLPARLGLGRKKSNVRGPRKDGGGVSWLRNRWQGLGLRNNSQSSPPTANVVEQVM